MNKEIIFASERQSDKIDIIELGEFSYASSKEKDLELINKTNEKGKDLEISK